MSIDTVADVFARRLPGAIKHIRANFDDCPELWQLKDRRILKLLIAKIPLAKPGDRIFFKRDKLADMAQVSEKTVDRHLSRLVEFNIIVRHRQDSLGNGQWSCPSFSWTSQALEKYILPAINREIERQRRYEKIKCENSHRGTNSTHNSNPSFIKRKASAEASSEKQQKNNGPAGELVGIPKDLHEPSGKLGLKREQILLLFNVCKENNQRLQDVLCLCLEVMIQQKITGKHAVGWLIQVIRNGGDFSWKLSQHRKQATKKLKVAKVDRLVTRVTSSLSTGRFTLPMGDVIQDVTELHFRVTCHKTGQVRTGITREIVIYLMRYHWGWVKQLLRGHIGPEKKPAPEIIQHSEDRDWNQKRSAQEVSMASLRISQLKSILKGYPRNVNSLR